MFTRRFAVSGGILALLFLAGCHGGSGTAVVTAYPRWDFQRYTRLAVAPGRAAAPEGTTDAGILADRLTSLLAQNGAFTVLSRTELKDVMAEQDLALLTDAEEGTVLPQGRIRIAQALVVPRITDYRLIATRGEQRVPVYGRDPWTGEIAVIGEDVIEVFTHGAEVEASVSVIDAATGRVLLRHTARKIPERRTSRGRPPSVTPQQLAAAAARALASEFYRVIAPTEMKIKVKSEMLVVATAYFDGKYETPKKLPLDLDEFLLVVRDLPEVAEGNPFRVALAEREGRQNIFEQDFTWSETAGPEGVTVRVPMATLTATPSREFAAKLYSGRSPEPILVREFEIAAEGKSIRQSQRSERTRVVEPRTGPDSADTEVAPPPRERPPKVAPRPVEPPPPAGHPQPPMPAPTEAAPPPDPAPKPETGRKPVAPPPPIPANKSPDTSTGTR